MKIKDGFVLRKIASQYMAVPVGARAKELHGMIGLNETGAFIWDRLSNDRTEKELVADLCEVFDVDEQTAEESVKRFCKTLLEEGMLADE